jgi:hypothetical protein
MKLVNFQLYYRYNKAIKVFNSNITSSSNYSNKEAKKKKRFVNRIQVLAQSLPYILVSLS